MVFVASRMSSLIGAYDIRNPLGGPYMVFERPGETQQRMEFSVDWAGRSGQRRNGEWFSTVELGWLLSAAQ